MRVSRHSLCAAIAILAASVLPATAQTEHEWTVQTIWQAGDVNHSAVERWAENVAAKTDGRVEIEVVPIGSVVGYTETVDAVQAGLLTGHVAFPGYWSGREPGLSAIGDLPGAYANPSQAQEMMEAQGGLDLLREMYAKFNMYPIGVTWWGMESIPTRVELNGIADLKGVKVRAPQGIASDLFTKLGASVVNLPGSEVYGAFEKGVIDATDWGTLAMNEDIGIHSIAKGFVYPGIHSMPLADVSVSVSAWEALSPDLQQILTESVRALASDMIQSNARRDTKVLEELKATDIEQYDWSDEERQKFKEAAVGIWQSYGERSPLAKKAIDLQVDFLKSQGQL